jgi:hypothetical protein
MTRHTKPESLEKEQRLQQAIAAGKSGTKTAAEAILPGFDVCRRAYFRRISGVPPRNKAHENQQFLTNAEEQELVRWITELTRAG